MSLRLAVLLCALIAFPALAQDRGLQPVAGQPSYTRIALQCGKDTSRPTFSNGEYAKAIIEAEIAIRDAQASRLDQRELIKAIGDSVSQLKKCQREEWAKFYILPMRNCSEFGAEYAYFRHRAAQYYSAGRITRADYLRVREQFRPAAVSCAREMMSKCLDPTKTRDVDYAIFMMNDLAEFGIIYTMKDEPAALQFLRHTTGLDLTLKFCNDTDYACKGDPEACDRRVTKLKEIMEYYIHNIER